MQSYQRFAARNLFTLSSPSTRLFGNPTSEPYLILRTFRWFRCRFHPVFTQENSSEQSEAQITGAYHHPFHRPVSLFAK